MISFIIAAGSFVIGAVAIYFAAIIVWFIIYGVFIAVKEHFAGVVITLSSIAAIIYVAVASQA